MIVVRGMLVFLGGFVEVFGVLSVLAGSGELDDFGVGGVVGRRVFGGDVGDEALGVSVALDFEGGIAEIHEDAIDFEHPDEGVFGKEARQAPVGVHR